jgi:hypothetical protein
MELNFLFITLLGMGEGGGAYRPPPFFNGQIVIKTLSAKNLKKNSIPPFRSLFCILCFNFYQNHLVCLQNTFEKTYPESKSPKCSCHMLCWFDICILQINITPGRLCFRPQQSGGGAWPQQSSENKIKLLKSNELWLSRDDITSLR